ncbi:MAG: hypothetical protein O2958_08385 [Gemmatimonadetes bacterium]|nr:hypothetical protein [Gemmatimonadota bacterium]MDA1104008.1 hypothetical protein [Gemmatimonadota bacterium]
MRAFVLSGLAVALLSGCGEAQSASPIRYEISFDNRAHHEAEITVTFDDLPSGPLEVRMSRTSPGRYALHEFAKNVYNVRATGEGGRAVQVTQPDNHQRKASRMWLWTRTRTRTSETRRSSPSHSVRTTRPFPH